LHHNFVVRNRRIVLTGGPNWTIDPEGRNDDYLLILTDPELTPADQQEFNRLRPAVSVGCAD